MDGIDERGAVALEIESRRDPESLVISLNGEADLSTVEMLQSALAEAEASDAKRIVVDLGGLEFIDSRGLRALAKAQAASRADSDRLRFRPGGQQVRRVMEVTGLERELRFLD